MSYLQPYIVEPRQYSSYHSGSPSAPYSPIHGGIAVYTKVPGYYPRINIGTLGGVVFDKKSGRQYLLSNQHVFFPYKSSSNVKPGLQVYHDYDKIADKAIAKTLIEKTDNKLYNSLQEAQKALPSKSSYHDSALAIPLVPVSTEVNNIGKQGKMILPKKGMRIKYYGRTSRLQRGVILNPSATIYASAPNSNKISIQKNIIMADIVSGGGDSGSMVLTEDNRVVGVLYAETVGKKSETQIARADVISNAYNVVFNANELSGVTPPKPLPEPEPKPKPKPEPEKETPPPTFPFPDIKIDLSDKMTLTLLAIGGIALVALVVGLSSK